MNGATTTTAVRTTTLRRCIGAGGFGAVYEAVVVDAGGIEKTVAIKVLHESLDPQSDAVARLKDEARALAGLNHRAILSYYALTQFSGRPALVTEYCEGLDLRAFVSTFGCLPPSVALDIVARAAEALDAAWTKLRIVHRDIKPENILVLKEGAIKVADFGIAKTSQFARQALTQHGAAIGTPHYMAPERFQAGDDEADPVPDVDPASDVFGLGCVLYEALTGERLFNVGTPQRMFGLVSDSARLSRHIDRRFETHASRLPPTIVDLLRQTLAYDLRTRPTFRQLEVACEERVLTLGGSPLRAWARDLTWPPPRNVPGDLVGQTFSENTLADKGALALPGVAPTADLPPTSRAQAPPADVGGSLTRSRAVGVLSVGAFLGGGALAIVGVGALLALGVAVASGAFEAPNTAPEPSRESAQGIADAPERAATPATPGGDAELPAATVGAQDPAPSPSTSPDESPTAGSERAPAGRAARVVIVDPPRGGVAPSQPSASAGSAAPAAASPSPDASEPATLAPVHLVIEPASSAAEVQVVVNGERRSLPVDIPSGTWEVVYRFPDRPEVSLGTVALVRGSVIVGCSSTMHTCSVR